MEKKWYVVYASTGFENKVRANLEHRISLMGMQDKVFRILVPTEEEIEYKDGKKRVTQKRVYPGYIFIEMLFDEETWHLIRSTPGVRGFIGAGNQPFPLPEEEVEKLLELVGMEEPRPRFDYSVGMPVRVIRGPFQNFEGVVEEIHPERGKLRITISMFGRETPIELDYGQVEKID